MPKSLLTGDTEDRVILAHVLLEARTEIAFEMAELSEPYNDGASAVSSVLGDQLLELRLRYERLGVMLEQLVVS